eukprot:627795-Alexandrium_andersonii.AAC.1
MCIRDRRGDAGPPRRIDRGDRPQHNRAALLGDCGAVARNGKRSRQSDRTNMAEPEASRASHRAAW